MFTKHCVYTDWLCLLIQTSKKLTQNVLHKDEEQNQDYTREIKEFKLQFSCVSSWPQPLFPELVSDRLAHTAQEELPQFTVLHNYH